MGYSPARRRSGSPSSRRKRDDRRRASPPRGRRTPSRSRSRSRSPVSRKRQPSKSRSRSPQRGREYSRERDRYNPVDVQPKDSNSRRWRRNDQDGHPERGNFNPNRDSGRQDQFWVRRREQRDEIGNNGVAQVWSRSPPPMRDSDDEEAEARSKAVEAAKRMATEEEEKEEKRKRKKKLKKAKKHKKSRSKKNSSDEDEAPPGPSWLPKNADEEPVNVGGEQDEDEIGPTPRANLLTSDHRAFGKALLPGEGAAMAAFVAEGKRIPRRGEIGLTSDEIVTYEQVGYVMSGSRHRRMEAVRLRKENQIYSADEKRALETFDKDERQKRENKILSQFRELVKSKTSKK
ncbi:hypothetical protein RvY_00353 [Ramazzottius varieornatus]|uniref:NF-kappa-B-activating protein C-terminal domain-containing protein n=1 Tax=Ramazzottius varieornatus TaxID=947166 RepID=A0A1D1UIT0_RAMVA|nr:hypothetical protein RvY_00353 [Ramazzottius varieornatus]